MQAVEQAGAPYVMPSEGSMWTPLDHQAAREMGVYIPLGCGDDRWPHGGIQFFAGITGAGLYTGAAMNMHGKRFDQAASGIDQPIDELALVIEAPLATKGLLGVNHMQCAGHDKMKDIALTGIVVPGMGREEEKIASLQRKAAYAHVQEYNEMDEDRFDQISAELAYLAIKYVRDPEISAEAMQPSNGEKYVRNEKGLLVPTQEGIPLVPIGDRKHEAELVIVNDDPRHGFDAMDAWDQGLKAYHVSMGHLPAVHQAVNTYLGPGTKYEDLRDAAAVFTAKTILNLPTPVTGQPLRVQYLERVQAVA